MKTALSREIHLFTFFQVLLLTVSVICCIIGVIIKLTTSQNTHDISLASVIRTSMDFFYENPIGRILNRFTKDTDVLDDELGRVLIRRYNKLSPKLSPTCYLTLWSHCYWWCCILNARFTYCGNSHIYNELVFDSFGGSNNYINYLDKARDPWTIPTNYGEAVRWSLRKTEICSHLSRSAKNWRNFTFASQHMLHRNYYRQIDYWRL